MLCLQSKASCMPARALQPQPGWTILDACAAPGNKTTHIAGESLQISSQRQRFRIQSIMHTFTENACLSRAALMGDRGRVLAFDRDPKRLERLKANAALTGATSIEAHCRDFLETDPFSAELAGVQGILLDPSCSGSGTVRRSYFRSHQKLSQYVCPECILSSAPADLFAVLREIGLRGLWDW